MRKPWEEEELEHADAAAQPAVQSIAAPAGDPRAAMMRMQQGAGNQAVARALARQPEGAEAAAPAQGGFDPMAWLHATQELQKREGEVEPHEGGGVGEVMEQIAHAGAQAFNWIEEALGLDRQAAGTAAAAAPDHAAAPGAAAKPAEAAKKGPLTIHESVGKGGKNQVEDVDAVAAALKELGYGDGSSELDALGAAIEKYQSEHVKGIKADGRVDPGGRTLKSLGGGGPAPAAKQPTPAGPQTAPAAPAAAPGNAAAAEVPADAQSVTEWQSRKIETNSDYAQWILDGEGMGFVTFTSGMGSKNQMLELAAGKKVQSADPSKQDLIGGLFTIHGIVNTRVGRWLGDTTKDKTPLMVGSFLRSDGHKTGGSIDLNGLDFAGEKGPQQVADMLADLPKGKYGIGLPFQGDFFPTELNLETKMKEEQGKAGKEGTPADITETCLQKFVTGTYTAKWNPTKTEKGGGWDIASKGGKAVDHLKSEVLKKGIQDLNTAGYTIYVFPDNNNHIHIQH